MLILIMKYWVFTGDYKEQLLTSELQNVNVTSDFAFVCRVVWLKVLTYVHWKLSSIDDRLLLHGLHMYVIII